jgi:hypothetical protein
MVKFFTKTVCMVFIVTLCVGVSAQNAPQSNLKNVSPAERAIAQKATVETSSLSMASWSAASSVIVPDRGNRAEVLNEPFSSPSLPAGWTTLDVDGDGYTWQFTQTDSGCNIIYPEGHGDTYSINSASYYNCIGALNPNNWLISPSIALGSSSQITYWVRTIDVSYSHDHYGVYVSTTGTNPSDFTLLFEETLTSAQNVWTQRTVNLTQSGANCHIAFRHFSSYDVYIFCIDDVIVTTEGDPGVDDCPAVTNLEAEVQGTDVKLTWTAATGSPTGYKVYEGTTELATVTVTEYLAKNLSDGDHTFAVAAIYDDECTPVKVTVTANIKKGNPIKNLDGACDDGTLTLTWDDPDAKGNRDDITLQYCNAPGGGFGTNGACELWPAIRYTSDDLAALGVTSGMELTTVGFAPWVPSLATFTIKVWQGGNWTIKDPGTELISQVVPGSVLVAEQWSDITLDTPIEIDATKELWIGYKMVATGNVPAGRDLGPTVAPNKSNICYDGTFDFVWTSLLDLGPTFTMNWCIRGIVEGEPGVIEISNYDIYQDDVHFDVVAAPANSYTKTGVEGAHNYCVVAVYDNGAQSPKVCKEISCGEIPPPCDPITGGTAEIGCDEAVLTWTAVTGAVGYKISKDGNFIVSVTEPTYTETGTFVHGETYKWEIETVCASDVSVPVEVSGVAVCESINELSNNVAIFPNPSSGMVTITAKDFAKVEVYNTVGQLVETRTINTVDVSSYNTGIYFFKVYDSNNNNVTKRVMVTK